MKMRSKPNRSITIIAVALVTLGLLGAWLFSNHAASGQETTGQPLGSSVKQIATESLKLLRIVTVAPESEGGGARPEVAATADRVFVVYHDNMAGGPAVGPAFRAKAFSSDLSKLIASKPLVSSTQTHGRTTDIRVASDAKHLYAFYETADQRIGTFLWGAKYTLDDRFERVAHVGPIAQTKFWAITQGQVGDELVDDPIPVVGPESVFVITRLKGKSYSKKEDTVYRVREYTPDLKQVSQFDLNLSKVADGAARQAAALFWRDHFYMVLPTTSEEGDFPVDMATPSDLLMVKLNRKWEVVESKRITDARGEVSAWPWFQEHSGRFYVVCKQGSPRGGFVSPLRIYDEKFNLLLSETVRVPAGRGEALRPSLAVTDRHVFVAFGIGQGPPPFGGRRMPAPEPAGQPREAVVYVYERTGSKTAERAAQPQPVYVYLFAHYEDHINLDLSEWRIKEVMRILSDAHRAHPDRVAAVGEFYGADSEIFRQRNRESGIMDLIRRCVGEGWYDVGYHGAHEPIYVTTQRATRNLTGKSWKEIYAASRLFYTAHRDLKTGEQDASRKGGVALMQEVFGPATVVSGAAGATDPPGMLAFSDLTGCRVFFGFTDHGPAMFNKDYIPAVLEIRKAVSPTPETSPDVFWFMGCLITSSHPVSREVGVISSVMPPDQVTAKFQRLDRTRVAVPHMMYGAKFIYARASPTEYAYGGDRNPAPFRATREARGDDFRLPPELLVAETERKQKIENFRQNLDWLLTKYFPVNSGSRCVGNRLLLDLTAPYAGDSISAAELDRAVEGLLRDWKDRPPSFTSTGETYLTLGQTFKLLASALRSHVQNGSLPAAMQTDMTYGPIGLWSEVVQGAEAEIDGSAVIAATADIAFGPERRPGKPEPPGNRVPLNVTADGKTMHAAQFLRLMAETYQALRAGKTPGVLRVRSSNILPPLAMPWQRVHPLCEDTPAAYGFLQLWTVKPAQFKEAMKK